MQLANGIGYLLRAEALNVVGEPILRELVATDGRG
jgi:hypothetical protein